MEITSKIDGTLAVLTMAGRLDAATSSSVDQAVKTAVGGGITHLAFDMAQVEYVSSAGLRSLLLAARQAKAAGGAAAVCSLQPSVAEVFTVSGFGKVIIIAADQAEARQRLAG